MNKIVDKNYCMSSFLAFRYIAREDTIFGGVLNMQNLSHFQNWKK